MAGLLIGQDAVSAELRLWAQTAFAWGQRDCLLSIVHYVARVTGRTVPDWPRYSSGAGAARILRRHGGLEPYAAMVMAGMGCRRTIWPVRGDVGLINVPGSGLGACLSLGRQWAMRGPDGVVITSVIGRVTAWAVDPGRSPCPLR